MFFICSLSRSSSGHWFKLNLFPLAIGATLNEQSVKRKHEICLQLSGTTLVNCLVRFLNPEASQWHCFPYSNSNKYPLPPLPNTSLVQTRSIPFLHFRVKTRLLDGKVFENKFQIGFAKINTRQRQKSSCIIKMSLIYQDLLRTCSDGVRCCETISGTKGRGSSPFIISSHYGYRGGRRFCKGHDVFKTLFQSQTTKGGAAEGGSESLHI